MKFDSLLIQKPQAQTRLQRTTFGVITGMFWAVYAYLWMPLLTLLPWLLGVRTAMFELYFREHRIEPFVLLALPVLAVLCTLSLVVWAEYNRYRFPVRDRRWQQPSIHSSRIAAALGADRNTAALLSDSKVVLLHMDVTARPEGITVLRTDPQRPRRHACNPSPHLVLTSAA